MGFFWKKLKRGVFSSSSFVLICLLLSVLCLVCLLNLKLPELSLENSVKGSYKMLKPGKRLEEVQLGKLGEMMVAMLPVDLAFTIFVPSEKTFERVLKLRAKDTFVEQTANDTFAVLSRLMGFSAVPQHLPSVSVPLRKELSFDSVSGYRLYARKVLEGTLVVNNIWSERVDVKMGEKTIVHIMSGVIMDAEFEQSFRPDYED